MSAERDRERSDQVFVYIDSRNPRERERSSDQSSVLNTRTRERRSVSKIKPSVPVRFQPTVDAEAP